VLPQSFSSPNSRLTALSKESTNQFSAVVTRNPFTYSTLSEIAGRRRPAHTWCSPTTFQQASNYVAGSCIRPTTQHARTSPAARTLRRFVMVTYELPVSKPRAQDQIAATDFQAQLNSSAPPAVGLVNTASKRRNNATSTRTEFSVVVADPFGTVSPDRAPSIPVWSKFAVYADQASNKPCCPLPRNIGRCPNTQNGHLCERTWATSFRPEPCAKFVLPGAVEYSSVSDERFTPN